ncbi:MAG TPA: hypothetical protein VI524_11165 [Anaerolineales bacterium]|nr:hypothetical protein [Anaerolineales bacterium]
MLFRVPPGLLTVGFTGKEELALIGVMDNFSLEANFVQQPQPIFKRE